MERPHSNSIHPFFGVSTMIRKEKQNSKVVFRELFGFFGFKLNEYYEFIINGTEIGMALIKIKELLTI